MKFVCTDSTHDVPMDAKKPFGSESAMSPKDLVVAGLCGCTAMDVVGLLKKHKATVTEFEIDADVTASTTGHPVVFSEIQLLFRLQGTIDPDVLLESIRLSQSKYCGVSAMLSRAVPIVYQVKLNGQKIGEGRADFVS
jgi:putative redox protein